MKKITQRDKKIRRTKEKHPYQGKVKVKYQKAEEVAAREGEIYPPKEI